MTTKTETVTRKRLPDTRPGLTHKFRVGAGEEAVKGYITIGYFPDGTIGEVFVKMDQQGSQVSGFCDAWSIAFSMLLQTGFPIEKLIQKFRGMKFEPKGLTGNPEIPIAGSPIDYVVRWLALKAEATRMIMISVNGLAVDLPAATKEIGYALVMTLAEMTGHATVVYHKGGDPEKPDGSLIDGQSVAIKNGTTFTVAHTGSA